MCTQFIGKIEGFPDNGFSPGADDRGKDILAAAEFMDSYPLVTVYTLAFHWGLSSVASLGSDLRPISLAELLLGISVRSRTKAVHLTTRSLQSLVAAKSDCSLMSRLVFCRSQCLGFGSRHT